MKITEQELIDDVMSETSLINNPIRQIYTHRTSYGFNKTSVVFIDNGEVGAGLLTDFINFYLDKKLKEIKKAEEIGEIVLTSTEDGELVAVTRQDEEGRILKVIWSKK